MSFTDIVKALLDFVMGEVSKNICGCDNEKTNLLQKLIEALKKLLNLGKLWEAIKEALKAYIMSLLDQSSQYLYTGPLSYRISQ